jgi:hypothetical protein
MSTRGWATLHGYGRLPWIDLLSTIDDAPAAWADYDGFHIGPAPSQPPPYTHLWAWTPGWLLRARIDGAHAIVAILQIGDASPSGLIPRSSEQVRYTRRSSHTWPASENRVGRLGPDVADRNVDLYELGGEFPVTFISLNER